MKKESPNFTEQIKKLAEPDREKILKVFPLLEEKNADINTGGASILLDLEMDAQGVIAALMLNLADDENIFRAVKEIAGKEPETLAKAAAKISRVSYKSKTLREAEIIRNMFFVMTDDYRAMLIMLAEKLKRLRASAADEISHNEAKTKSETRNCLDVYAPLAGRLGISWLKDEMEDLCLKILNREVYRQIKDMVAAKRKERNEFLALAEKEIAGAASKAGINIEVKSRAKHFHSIYMKMRKRNKSAAEIFDLFGIRILCESTEQCYTLLGIVHRLWKPVEGGFKDYIAKPKPNGYQSLHTAVIISAEHIFSDEDRFLEIQIRTGEMHHIAEYGVASHWLYKRGSARELVGLSSEKRDSRPGALLFDEIKRQIVKKFVYVFTPQGRVMELPRGSTPIDFAYSIHSAVGDHCIGAKADGSIIPLYSELKNTQTVEILTGTKAHPTINWLMAAKTSRARGKIRSWLEKHEELAPNEKETAKKKSTAGEPLQGAFASSDHAPHDNPIQTGQRVLMIPGNETMRVKIEDEKNMLLRFARCCHPVNGDSITGYVSRGRGIIIHRKGCSNLSNIPDFAERQIEAEWENSSSFTVKRFRIEARMSANLFSEIEGAARKHKGHLIEGRLEENLNHNLTGFFAIRFEKAEELKAVMKKIRAVPGVISISPL